MKNLFLLFALFFSIGTLASAEDSRSCKEIRDQFISIGIDFNLGIMPTPADIARMKTLVLQSSECDAATVSQLKAMVEALSA